MKKFLLISLLISIGLLSANGQCNSHSKKSYSSNHHKSDIVQTALNADDLSTLVVALKAAQLVETLSGKGPFTVFAPTNTAFAKLPEGTVADLLKPENKSTLQKVLSYHVVEGNFNSKDIVSAIEASGGDFEVTTVAGEILTVSIRGKAVLLTDQKGRKVAVQQTDINASNGIIHIIDGVVLP